METKDSRVLSVQETIERYVYQVAHRLPDRSRKDVEQELSGLIEDMLEARCKENAPEKADVDAVLKELGSPAAFAAQYGSVEGRPNYLIGPGIFQQYVSVLKIVLFAVSVGMVVTSILQSFAKAGDMTAYGIFALWVGNIFSALFSAAAAVTLLFAILERRGVKLDAMDADWLAELPPVPAKESRFSRGECIFGIVASLLFLLLFVAAPDYIAVFTEGSVIPLFNMELYPALLPLIAASCVLGVVKEVAKLMEGRYTVRLAAGLTVLNAVSIVLCVIVLSQPIWNRSLLLLIQGAADLDNAAFWGAFWNSFGQVLLAAVLLGYVADTVGLWYHTLKSVREAG